MRKQAIKDLFRQAIDWNMICFDKNAPPNRISAKLLDLMQESASKKDKVEIEGEWTHMPPFEIDTLYIPEGAPYDKELDHIVIRTPHIHRYAYIKAGGNFPFNKYDIVLAVGRGPDGNDVGLLGAF